MTANTLKAFPPVGFVRLEEEKQKGHVTWKAWTFKTKHLSTCQSNTHNKIPRLHEMLPFRGDAILIAAAIMPLLVYWHHIKVTSWLVLDHSSVNGRSADTRLLDGPRQWVVRQKSTSNLSALVYCGTVALCVFTLSNAAACVVKNWAEVWIATVIKAALTSGLTDAMHLISECEVFWFIL